MPRRLSEIADEIGRPHDVTKTNAWYELYERYFEQLADLPVTLMELGVYTGESAKVFASYFKRGKIIGVDFEDRGTDFSAFPNIVFANADQRDADRLNAVCAAHAPDGIDIIIDDASHIGAWSLRSYSVLYPHLKPGGLYIIEDWSTGYWDDWPDGSSFQRFTSEIADGPIPKRLPSHDFGMVGFVKFLVDEATWAAIRPTRGAPRTRAPKWEFMNIHPEMVVLKKAPATIG